MAFFYPRAEYLRPWKLLSLATGIVLLVLGSIFTPAPDWDIPVSFLMAGLTYLSAPCSLRVLLERRWRQLPMALLWTWFSVDGGYAIYWYFRDPEALATMRSANAPASFVLYGTCALIWYYRGSLRAFLGELGSLRRGPP